MKVFIDALDAKLSAIGPFNTAMGGRIYHMLAPDNAPLPHLVYSIITSGEERSFGNVLTHVVTVQFDIWAAETDANWATYEPMLYALLQGVALTPEDHDRGLVLFDNRYAPSVEEDAIRIMCEATIQGTDF